MRLERKHEKLLSARLFVWRVLSYAGVAALMVVVALGIGVAGYHWMAGFSWVDAFLNASMLLGGMGPVGALDTTAGKLFASFYALGSGLVFIVAVGTVLAPIVHRALHRFHLDR